MLPTLYGTFRAPDDRTLFMCEVATDQPLARGEPWDLNAQPRHSQFCSVRLSANVPKPVELADRSEAVTDSLSHGKSSPNDKSEYAVLCFSVHLMLFLGESSSQCSLWSFELIAWSPVFAYTDFPMSTGHISSA